jgi:hypothetical protein
MEIKKLLNEEEFIKDPLKDIFKIFNLQKGNGEKKEEDQRNEKNKKQKTEVQQSPSSCCNKMIEDDVKEYKYVIKNHNLKIICKIHENCQIINVNKCTMGKSTHIECGNCKKILSYSKKNLFKTIECLKLKYPNSRIVI